MTLLVYCALAPTRRVRTLKVSTSFGSTLTTLSQGTRFGLLL